MKVALVGNGPSAAGCGEQIDAADLVVRMTGYWFAGAKGAGRRLDYYAWFGAKEHAEVPAVPCEHWATLPLSQATPPSATGVLQWGRMVEAGQPVRFVRENLWRMLRAAVVLEARGADVTPSTGFTALAMVLEVLKPAEVVLYGYDATMPEQEGWGDGNREWAAISHDFLAQKHIMARLMRGRRWLGQPCQTRLSWHAMPAGV